MKEQKAKRNIYKHSIDLKKIKLLNAPRDKFREELEKIPYRGYEVEDLSDGRKIVIAKPGGKSVYGRPKKEDFLVWIYSPTDNTLWQISHKEILTDIKLKSEHNSDACVEAICCLEKVHAGIEPSDVLENCANIFSNLPGESLEAILYAYKWIWGQEDVNYPTGEGRDMSMKAIKELKEQLLSK